MDRVNATNVTANATGEYGLNGTATEEWTHGVMFKLRTSVLLLIVVMAVLGNLLVIVSVMRHRCVTYINLLCISSR